MRFITEFELRTEFEVKNYKGFRQWGTAQALGMDIAKAFGWKVREEATTERHAIEIEAFPKEVNYETKM